MANLTSGSRNSAINARDGGAGSSPRAARRAKLALAAATALISAAGALAPVHAGQLDPAAFPATVEAPVAPAHHDERATAPASKMAERAALIAVALGALGWLVKLLGPKKVLKAVEKTAEATVRATGEAAKSVGRAMRSPLRFLGWMAGVLLFAFLGVGFYDIEWIGGLIAGGAAVGLAAFQMFRVKRALAVAPLKAKARQMVNRS